MSHLASMFGPIEPPPEAVSFRGFTLCKACSRGLHADHDPTDCQCDLEEQK